MRELLAPAKINLALVVGPRRADGRHEVATVLQRISLADRIRLRAADALRVEGFTADTLVRRALESLAAEAGVEPRWAVELDKQIPVAAGLGGGSSDAAAALRLANGALDDPLDETVLRGVAAGIGADVPFFLAEGPQLGEGDGTELSPLELPQDYWVVLVVPDGVRKESTASVYEAFDRRGGDIGFDERRAVLRDALRRGDLAALPPNDLASSPVADELRTQGAFRADVTGAGPAVYGLFTDEAEAVAAVATAMDGGEKWLLTPAW